MQNNQNDETQKSKSMKITRNLHKNLSISKKKVFSMFMKRKNFWTIEQDEILAKAVFEYGSKRWSLISKCLKNRNPKRCRERWINYLANKNLDWNDYEYWLLFLSYKVYGNKWCEIAKIINRGDNIVKNKVLCMKKKRVQQFQDRLNFLKSNLQKVKGLKQIERNLISKLILESSQIQKNQMTNNNNNEEESSSQKLKLVENQSDKFVIFNNNNFITQQNYILPAFYGYIISQDYFLLAYPTNFFYNC